MQIEEWAGFILAAILASFFHDELSAIGGVAAERAARAAL